MKIQCPQCRQIVPADKINVATDLAVCPACNEGFRVSYTVDLEQVNEQSLEDPPGGAWHRQTMNGVVVGATTRSPAAFFIVPFMIVWSGFSIGGIYGSQLASGEFNPGTSLFGIPFLIGSLLFWGVALMTICGKVEITIDGDRGSVFTGVGPIGWARRFDWSNVTSIREEVSNVRYSGSHGQCIVLEGRSRIKFGSGVNEKRRYFLLNALKYQKARGR